MTGLVAASGTLGVPALGGSHPATAPAARSGVCFAAGLVVGGEEFVLMGSGPGRAVPASSANGDFVIVSCITAVR